ncbi:MAG: GNAT family N-acetyltransferase [Ruminococcaceae bacterium]|nr:GNAT family N-acetyltransferase [Oscillospiraceae bacterium]
MSDRDKFTFRTCGPEELDTILTIQEEAFALLEDNQWLRRNSRETLDSCLRAPHVTIGVYCGDEMAAFGVLYIAGESEENLGRKMGLTGDDILSTANFKLVIVRPAYRGNGLQRALTVRLEQIARDMGCKRICASVSPCNRFSADNFEAMGYKPGGHAVLYGGLERSIYYKKLTD